MDVEEEDLDVLLPLPCDLLQLRRLDIAGSCRWWLNHAAFENCDVPTLLYRFGTTLVLGNQIPSASRTLEALPTRSLELEMFMLPLPTFR